MWLLAPTVQLIGPGLPALIPIMPIDPFRDNNRPDKFLDSDSPLLCNLLQFPVDDIVQCLHELGQFRPPTDSRDINLFSRVEIKCWCNFENYQTVTGNRDLSVLVGDSSRNRCFTQDLFRSNLNPRTVLFSCVDSDKVHESLQDTNDSRDL